MADFPSTLWLREPVIGGRRFSGGELTRAATLLKQARDEVVAIETALGTDVAGSATNLLNRLATRHSKSGIPRGRVYGKFGNQTGWYTQDPLRAQFGVSNELTTGNPTINFNTAYSVAPSVVVVRFVVHPTDLCPGDVQLDKSSIGTSSFRVNLKLWSTAGTWVDPSAGSKCLVLWAAFGGS